MRVIDSIDGGSSVERLNKPSLSYFAAEMKSLPLPYSVAILSNRPGCFEARDV